MLHDAGRGGRQHVGREGADDDQVEVLGGQAGVGQGPLRPPAWPGWRWIRPATAMRRSRMPVRWTIHSSEVSTIFSRSALVSRRSGSAQPVPAMTVPIHFGRKISGRLIEQA